MQAEDFARATEADLRQKANDCFERLHESGSHEKPALLIESQFYMDEIERRKQDKIAARDHRLELIAIGLEIIVVGLICLELLEGGGQSKVLDALVKSADTTTTSMKLLQKEQEDALQTQRQTLHTLEQINTAMQAELNFLSVKQIHHVKGQGGAKVSPEHR